MTNNDSIIYRNAIDGRFVTRTFAEKHPAITMRQTVHHRERMRVRWPNSK